MLEPWERDLLLARATQALELIANTLKRIQHLAEERSVGLAGEMYDEGLPPAGMGPGD